MDLSENFNLFHSIQKSRLAMANTKDHLFSTNVISSLLIYYFFAFINLVGYFSFISVNSAVSPPIPAIELASQQAFQPTIDPSQLESSLQKKRGKKPRKKRPLVRIGLRSQGAA